MAAPCQQISPTLIPGLSLPPNEGAWETALSGPLQGQTRSQPGLESMAEDGRMILVGELGPGHHSPSAGKGTDLK